MKRAAAIVLLVLALAGVFLSVTAGRQGTASPGLPGPALGHLAPAFSLPGVQGGTVSLASLRGTVVLINFWATWCPDCRQELPSLQRLHQQEGSAVAILGVDVHEPRALVRLFVQQQGLAWPILLDGTGSVTAQYGVYYLPTSFFLSRSGVIRRIYTGPMTLGQMRSFVRDAAAPA